MTTFVGREKELALLDQRFEGALASTGRTIFLSAEAGAGKSTLLEHFRAGAASRAPEALFIQAACSEQYGAGEPYQPFVEAFRALVAEKAARRGRSFRDIAKAVAPFWLSAIPVAGEVIAASVATVSEVRSSLFKSGPGESAAPSEEALFFQYTELLFSAAQEQPVVLFLDDLHWADRATVSLLTHLARRIPERKILIIGTYRPVDVDTSGHPMRDARRELERYRVAEELALQPLGSGALRALTEQRLGGRVDPELLDWLEKRAGANALFYEELLGWVIEQGLTEERRGTWALARRPTEIEVPRSVEATIEKRLSRLDEDTRKIVDYASVGGNEFDSVTLARLLEADELEVEDALEPIAKVHRLIRLTETRDLPGGDIASVYEFSHSIVQDVLHNGIMGKRRILLHRKMAQILEELYSGQTESIARRLAVHFEEGRQPERAFEFALIAAERASRVYAHWDAIDYVQRALRNAPGDGPRARALEQMADEQIAVGRLPEGFASYLEALDLALAAGADGQPLRLRRKILLTERDQGARPVQDITSEFAALREDARAANDAVEQCQILWHIITLPGSSEAVDVALAREALALAESSGDKSLIAKGRSALGWALVFGGDPAEAPQHFEAAIRMYEELADRGHEGRCRNGLAVAYMFVGDNRKAAVELDGVIKVFDEIVDPLSGNSARNNLGALLLRVGDLDRAEKVLLEALDIAQRMEMPAKMLSPLQNLADLEEEREDWEAARRYWTALLERAGETGYDDAAVIAQCGLGTVALRLGDIPAARVHELEARSRITAEGGESWQRLQLFLARLAAAVGEREGAVGLLAAAEGQGGLQDLFDIALFRLERASILAPSAAAAAAELARQAMSAFEQQGAVRMVGRAAAILENTGQET